MLDDWQHCLCTSVSDTDKKTMPRLPVITAKNPERLNDSPNVVFSPGKQGLVDFHNVTRTPQRCWEAFKVLATNILEKLKPISDCFIASNIELFFYKLVGQPTG